MPGRGVRRSVGALFTFDGLAKRRAMRAVRRHDPGRDGPLGAPALRPAGLGRGDRLDGRRLPLAAQGPGPAGRGPDRRRLFPVPGPGRHSRRLAGRLVQLAARARPGPVAQRGRGASGGHRRRRALQGAARRQGLDRRDLRRLVQPRRGDRPAGLLLRRPCGRHLRRADPPALGGRPGRWRGAPSRPALRVRQHGAVPGRLPGRPGASPGLGHAPRLLRHVRLVRPAAVLLGVPKALSQVDRAV
ncbi:hypothetical protein SAMN02799626_03555 [Caulobacter sp. UNC279MFTsu5.1]|nr:hypothetical protein SAMN02799626_03555 [Caulobacter sp. UNC279MFTsu5.1]